MSDFEVTLTKNRYFGWHWHLEKDGLEMSDFAFTKWGAKKAVFKSARHWEPKIIVETYTLKGEQK